MERAVKVQVSLTMDLHMQVGESKYNMARTIEDQISRQLRLYSSGKIDSIRVFEGHGDDSTLSMREPGIELEGKLGTSGWTLERKDCEPPRGSASALVAEELPIPSNPPSHLRTTASDVDFV